MIAPHFAKKNRKNDITNLFKKNDLDKDPFILSYTKPSFKSNPFPLFQENCLQDFQFPIILTIKYGESVKFATFEKWTAWPCP